MIFSDSRSRPTADHGRSGNAVSIMEHVSTPSVPEGTVIAITPMAGYLLNKNSIKYEPVTTSHDPDTQSQDRYFDLQVAWLDSLDEKFTKHLAPLSRETKHYWLYQIHFLKSVMDILPIRAWQFHKIIREEKPTHVYLYTYLNRLKTPGHSLNFIGEPTAAELVLKEASKRYGFNLEIIKSIITEDSNCLNEETSQATIGKAKGIFYSLISFKEKASHSKHLLSKNDHQLNILACKNGYDIPGVLSRMRSKRHRTYVFYNRSLYLNSSPHSVKEEFTIDGGEFNRELENQQDKLQNIVQELDKEKWHLQWYDEFSGLPMSKYLMPRLRKFTINELSHILTYEKYCKYILNEFRIDYLINDSLSSHSDFGFALASKEVDLRNSVAIMHGPSWFKSRMWDYCELYPFDIYFASDQELAEYYRTRAGQLKWENEVYVGGGRFHKHSLKNIAVRAYSKYTYIRKLKKIFDRPNRPLVVYVTTMNMGDRRIMNFPYFSDPWYFELQKSIITAFSKQQNFNFVVKILKNGDSVQSPLKQYIDELNPTNIVLRDDIFFYWLHNADIFILDFPSTALYEVLAIKKPFFVLLHEAISIRDTITNYINDKIHEHVGKFSNTQEVETLISEFLSTYKSFKEVSYKTATTENIVSVLERRCSP